MIEPQLTTPFASASKAPTLAAWHIPMSSACTIATRSVAAKPSCCARDSIGFDAMRAPASR